MIEHLTIFRLYWIWVLILVLLYEVVRATIPRDKVRSINGGGALALRKDWFMFAMIIAAAGVILSLGVIVVIYEVQLPLF